MDEKLRHSKKMRRVGYWMTDKKIRRLNFDAFETLCRSSGINLVKLNLNESLEQQGPFNLILHKVTDQLSRSSDSSSNCALRHIDAIQNYMSVHPEIQCIDPIDSIMKLLDRHQQYQIVRDCDTHLDEQSRCYFIPAFAELTTNDVVNNARLIAENGIQFPIVCKPSLQHCNSSGAAPGVPLQAEREEMAIIFDEAGLADIETPCVVQTFVNHNARLFKIFIVGARRFIIQRPSIKNFRPGQDSETIFFNSNDVSKSYSSSHLNKMLDSEVDYPIIEPDEQKMLDLVSGIQSKFGLDLLGIDVIIENGTGRYGVIDINPFPGYDGVDQFFPALLELMESKMVDIPCSPNRTDDSDEENQTVEYQPSEPTTDIIPRLINTPFRALDPASADLSVLNSRKWQYFTASFCKDYLQPSTCGGHVERPLGDVSSANAREKQAVVVNSFSSRR